MKTLWVVLHHHRHGVDAHHFRSESEPTTKQIIETGVDFEEEREDEYLDVYFVHDDSITEL